MCRGRGAWCGPTFRTTGLLRLDECSGAVSTFMHPCGHHNGHALDAQGRIVACEHGGRRISRLEHDGRWKCLADRFEGKRFNSPNDVVVHSDGSVWFTDPTYGIDSDYEGTRAESEIGHCHVYRLDPASGYVRAVVSDMVRPNGLAFSVDERTLYVADTGATHDEACAPDIRAYDVRDGVVSGGRWFATCGAGLFDGFRVDRDGNIWASSADSVRAYASDGDADRADPGAGAGVQSVLWRAAAKPAVQYGADVAVFDLS